MAGPGKTSRQPGRHRSPRQAVAHCINIPDACGQQISGRLLEQIPSVLNRNRFDGLRLRYPIRMSSCMVFALAGGKRPPRAWEQSIADAFRLIAMSSNGNDGGHAMNINTSYAGQKWELVSNGQSSTDRRQKPAGRTAFPRSRLREGRNTVNFRAGRFFEWAQGAFECAQIARYRRPRKGLEMEVFGFTGLFFSRKLMQTADPRVADLPA